MSPKTTPSAAVASGKSFCEAECAAAAGTDALCCPCEPVGATAVVMAAFSYTNPVASRVQRNKAKELGIDIEKEKKVVKEVLRKVKELEHEGYQFEGAEGSLELLMKRALGVHKKYFDLVGFRVIVEKKEKDAPVSEATILVKVGERVEHTAGLGRGPVHALDNALRKALLKFYPALESVSLVDYKVRVLSSKDGTASVTRVLIESSDGKRTWETLGVSENILEASWLALVDSIDYKLLLEEEKGQ